MATVFGGSGFIGRYVVSRLAQQGYVVRAAVRDPEAALFLKPMGAVGQIVPLYASVTNEATVKRAVDGRGVMAVRTGTSSACCARVLAAGGGGGCRSTGAGGTGTSPACCAEVRAAGGGGGCGSTGTSSTSGVVAVGAPSGGGDAPADSF